MDIFEAVLVGVIQGVSEWLPISSEAVITLVLTAMGSEPSQALNASIFLHLGTMAAAFIYFRNEYWRIFLYLIEEISEPRKFVENPGKIMDDSSGRTAVFLFLSTLLTGLLGGFIYFAGLKTVLEYPNVFYGLMSIALLMTGVLRLYQNSDSRVHSSVDLKDSFLVGILQGFSVIPGISRSGITAFGFLFRGFDARSAFHLSFLMSVPAIMAGNIGLKLFTEFSFQPIYLVSAAVAGIVGYLTIEAVLEVADRAEISWICFALALIALIPILI